MKGVTKGGGRNRERRIRKEKNTKAPANEHE